MVQYQVVKLKKMGWENYVASMAEMTSAYNFGQKPKRRDHLVEMGVELSRYRP
jgi:hypothetical protein